MFTFLIFFTLPILFLKSDVVEVCVLSRSTRKEEGSTISPCFGENRYTSYFLNGTNVPITNSWQVVFPIYRHWTTIFPYHTIILRAFPWQIQSWDPRQWHRRDMPLDNIRNKYISSYQYHTVWYDGHHLRVLRHQW
uniref:Uncharacterized protein n=1 Tax=Asterionellopsis glacialis TaxID=33640 RepID=A0A7S0KXP3_9STRA